MKIAMIGYGKMGKEIEKIALNHGHEITARIDNNEDWNRDIDKLSISDVAVEFSIPDAVVNNIKKCFENDLPVVVGTTAWYEDIDEIRNLCINNGQSLIYASNFSIGVNILFEMNRKLAMIMNGRKEYDLSIEEIHHIHKIDAPSGTAIKLAVDSIEILDRKEEWSNTIKEDADKIFISSKREGEITGTHVIKYESDIDIIELKHQAKNRKGFATGALLAAEWIKDKKGFFEIRDMLNF